MIDSGTVDNAAATAERMRRMKHWPPVEPNHDFKLGKQKRPTTKKAAYEK